MSWKVILDNLSEKQAKQFAEWFDGEGEQNMSIWFDSNNVDDFRVDYTTNKDPINVNKKTQEVIILTTGNKKYDECSRR